MDETPGDYTAVWLQAGGCGGCATASLGAEGPDLPTTLETFGIRFLVHPVLGEECGEEMLTVLEAIAEGRTHLDALIVEGAVLRGPEGSGRFHILSGTDVPMAVWVRRLAARARHVIAVGTCAAFGGISASGANETEAGGLQYDGESPGGALGADFTGTEGLGVINVPGCAPHPAWIVETLTALRLGRLGGADLDALNRPRAYFSHLAHHGCARNEFYEFKASAEKFTDMGCLMENLGCQATQAHGDCNIRQWNGGGSCTSAGYPCIACTTPGFEEPAMPLTRTPKVAGIPVGLPLDMPKAWFVALAALSKSATPERVRRNATSDRLRILPALRRRRQ